MKVAVSSEGKNLTDSVAEVFGRCPFFLIAEVQNNKATVVEVLENTGRDQSGGVGISVAQVIVGKGVEAVIAGNVGPRALEVFRQFEIGVFSGRGSVGENLQKFIDGKLKKL